MTTWNYRVFREESGEYVIREVFYDEEGSILGCTENAVLPMGESLEELTQDLDYFKEALQLSVLTLGEVDAAVAARPPKQNGRAGKTISHEELVAKLGLASALQTIDNGFDNFAVGSEEIEVDSEKLCGTPVFPGTRVPIQNLFDCLEAGESVEEFLDQFPTVARDQAICVLEASKAKLIGVYEAIVF